MKKLKILVIEDDLIMMKIILNVLEESFDVKTATNGHLGLKAYKEFTPDIIITDLNMPAYDGLEMIKKIRQLDRQTKIIVYTSYQTVEYLLKATELNLTKYLLKPFNKEELLNALDMAMKDINNYELIQKKSIEFKDNFKWDMSKKILFNDNIEVKLTHKEKKFFDLLVSNIDLVITYDQIIDHVWDNEDFINKNALKTLVSTFKKKLPKDLIENIYAEGYKISKNSHF